MKRAAVVSLAATLLSYISLADQELLAEPAQVDLTQWGPPDIAAAEGSTIAIEYRWSQGQPERYAEIAAEFVRLKVDVIVTVGSAVPLVRRGEFTMKPINLASSPQLSECLRLPQ
jgi:hypothetical protein